MNLSNFFVIDLKSYNIAKLSGLAGLEAGTVSITYAARIGEFEAKSLTKFKALKDFLKTRYLHVFGVGDFEFDSVFPKFKTTNSIWRTNC